MQKFIIFTQYDGKKETSYSKREYSEKEANALFKSIKDTITKAKGFIIGEGEGGFYARTCKLSNPFTMRKELI